MEKNIILIIIIIMLSSLQSTAAPNKTGTTGALFLRLGGTPRAAAMGNAYTAVIDKMNATFGNPASAGALKTTEIFFSHNKWLADINYGYIGYAEPLAGDVGVAAALLYVDYGDIEGYDAFGYKINNPGARDRSLKSCLPRSACAQRTSTWGSKTHARADPRRRWVVDRICPSGPTSAFRTLHPACRSLQGTARWPAIP